MKVSPDSGSGLTGSRAARHDGGGAGIGKSLLTRKRGDQTFPGPLLGLGTGFPGSSMFLPETARPRPLSQCFPGSGTLSPLQFQHFLFGVITTRVWRARRSARLARGPSEPDAPLGGHRGCYQGPPPPPPSFLFLLNLNMEKRQTERRSSPLQQRLSGERDLGRTWRRWSYCT